MKVKTCLLVGLIMALSLSADLGNTSLIEGYRLGDIAPQINSAENKINIDFFNTSGYYTLVNFWAVYDAVSRVRNIQLAKAVNKLDSTRIQMLSISMDEKSSVFRETLKIDDLKSIIVLNDTQGKKSPLFKSYNLKKGFTNFLIDNNGVIDAKNVRAEDLPLLIL